MGVVPENLRIDALRRLGLSEPLVRQSAGERLHPLLGFRCQGPPWKSYHGAGCPGGPPLVPLWDCCDTVTGVRGGRPGCVEFIEFSVEAPEEYVILARTEQGLWAVVFDAIYEDADHAGVEDLAGAARAVGFRFLDRVAARDEAALGTFEGHREWLRRLVGGIDGEGS